MAKVEKLVGTESPLEVGQKINEIIEKGVGGCYTGQTIFSLDPLFEDGLHLLDGGIVYGDGVYAEFVNTYIANLYAKNPERFITEEQWQEHVNTYGACGRYVYDTVANTVRLPKVGDYLYSTSIENNAPVVGTGTALGLTSDLSKEGYAYNNSPEGSGIYPSTSNVSTPTVGSSRGSGSTTGNSRWAGITTDPTKSGIIADLSDITQPLEGYYYIVLATEAKTKLEVDLDNIAVDLNNKVDKQNMSAVSVCIEEYVNGSSWYRVYSDVGNGKWCEQGGVGGSTSSATASTITFLKPFANNTYSLTGGALEPENSKGVYVVGFYDRTPTQFSAGLSDDASLNKGTFTWVAKGYLA